MSKPAQRYWSQIRLLEEIGSGSQALIDTNIRRHALSADELIFFSQMSTP